MSSTLIDRVQAARRARAGQETPTAGRLERVRRERQAYRETLFNLMPKPWGTPTQNPDGWTTWLHAKKLARGLDVGEQTVYERTARRAAAQNKSKLSQLVDDITFRANRVANAYTLGALDRLVPGLTDYVQRYREETPGFSESELDRVGEVLATWSAETLGIVTAFEAISKVSPLARTVLARLPGRARATKALTRLPGAQTPSVLFEALRRTHPTVARVLAQAAREVPRSVAVGTGVTAFRGWTHGIPLFQNLARYPQAAAWWGGLGAIFAGVSAYSRIKAIRADKRLAEDAATIARHYRNYTKGKGNWRATLRAYERFIKDMEASGHPVDMTLKLKVRAVRKAVRGHSKAARLYRQELDRNARSWAPSEVKVVPQEALPPGGKVSTGTKAPPPPPPPPPPAEPPAAPPVTSAVAARPTESLGEVHPISMEHVTPGMLNAARNRPTGKLTLKTEGGDIMLVHGGAFLTVARERGEKQIKGTLDGEPVFVDTDTLEVTRRKTVKAGPIIRRIAKEMGIDINEVGEGSGIGGAITRKDLEAFREKGAPSEDVAHTQLELMPRQVRPLIREALDQQAAVERLGMTDVVWHPDASQARPLWNWLKRNQDKELAFGKVEASGSGWEYNSPVGSLVLWSPVSLGEPWLASYRPKKGVVDEDTSGRLRPRVQEGGGVLPSAVWFRAESQQRARAGAGETLPISLRFPGWESFPTWKAKKVADMLSTTRFPPVLHPLVYEGRVKFRYVDPDEIDDPILRATLSGYQAWYQPPPRGGGGEEYIAVPSHTVFSSDSAIHELTHAAEWHGMIPKEVTDYTLEIAERKGAELVEKIAQTYPESVVQHAITKVHHALPHEQMTELINLLNLDRRFFKPIASLVSASRVEAQLYIGQYLRRLYKIPLPPWHAESLESEILAYTAESDPDVLRIEGTTRVPPIPYRIYARAKEKPPEDVLKGLPPMHFREPSVPMKLASKEYTLRLMGVEPLLKDTVEAYKRMSLELRDIDRWLRKITKKIEKQAGTTIRQKLRAVVKGVPTPAIARMRNLLDENANAPAYLKGEDLKNFQDLRAFTQLMLRRVNEVRAVMNIKPIEDIGEYVPHFFDALTESILRRGDIEGIRYHDISENLRYWLSRKTYAALSEHMWNPTEKTRKLVREDVKRHFSKDLPSLLRTMARFDLREIYLTEPMAVLRARLSALGDAIPASVRREIDKFLRYDIRNYMTELDQYLNATLRPAADVMNLILTPFGRHIANPIRTMSVLARRSVVGGTLIARPKIVIRNLLQRMLIMDLYPLHIAAMAQVLRPPPEVRKLIKETTFYQISRRGGFEDISGILLSPERLGMLPYQISHAGLDFLSNVNVSMTAGELYAEMMLKWQDTEAGRKAIEALVEGKGIMGRAWHTAYRLFRRPLPTRESLRWTEQDLVDEAVDAGLLTQWLYSSTGLPGLWRGQAARMALSLQSWWFNYMFMHLRECAHRMAFGTTSRGKILRPQDRINALKGMLMMLAVLNAVAEVTGLGYQRFFLPPGSAPQYLSPTPRLLLNVYRFLTATTPKARRSAWGGIKTSAKAHIPFWLAVKEINELGKGEITVREWLFYLLNPETLEQAQERRKVRFNVPLGP